MNRMAKKFKVVFNEKEKENLELNKLKNKYQLLQTENKILGENLAEIKEVLENQNQVLAKHSVYLQKLVEVAFPSSQDFQIFPIKCIEELEAIEKKINEFEKGKLTKYIKSYIGPSTNISKCVGIFLTHEFILKCNWNGQQKKLALNKSLLFNKFVFEAVKTETFGYSDYKKAMRRGSGTPKIKFISEINPIYRN